ncbi:MAG: SEL1-like repeat protein [Clostridia bacterium]|nr:SEL1-like repeat protein [Clostridia bacterium]
MDKNLKNLLFLAENGDSEAMLKLGLYYDDDADFEDEDPYLAFEYYYKAHILNNLSASCKVLKAYLTGYGTEKNIPLAIELLNYILDKNEENSYFPSYELLSAISLYEITDKELIWKIASYEHLDASYFSRFADLYLKGLYVDKNKEKSVFLLKRAFEKGYSNSAHDIARIYLTDTALKSESEAIKYFYIALENGSEDALKDISYFSDHATLDKKRLNEIINNLSIQATRNHILIANLYLEGKYIDKNESLALKLLLEASYSSSGAIEKIISLYEKGIATLLDVKQAISNILSNNKFGIFEYPSLDISLVPHINKIGDKELMRTFLDKFEANLKKDKYANTTEMISFANIFYHGRFIEKDIPKSIYWYEKAIESEVNPNRYSTVNYAYLTLANIYASSEYIAEHKERALSYYLSAICSSPKYLFADIAFDISKSMLSREDIENFLNNLKGNAEKNANSALWLGYIYNRGYLVSKDLDEAIKWYLLSDKSRTHYHLDLAEIYKRKGDYKNAKEHAEKCLSSSHPSFMAYEILGQIYANESFDCFDIEKAIDCYKKAILNGDEYAITNLKALSSYNIDVDSILYDIYSQVIKMLNDMPDNALIKVLLAFFKIGIANKNDFSKIISDYEALDIHNGELYRLYEGLNDWENAIKVLKKRLDKPMDKEFNLRKIALCYERSNIYEKAFEYWQELANLMDNRGMFKVGYYYETGIGVKRSYSEAVKWYEKCLDTSNEFSNYTHTEAYTRLGMLYENGSGVARNYQKARECYEKALQINYGYPECAYRLGKLYENGHGVGVNYERAIEYYQLAEGLEDAKIAIEELTERLNTHYEEKFSITNSGKRHDIFVSWNHNDKKFMDKLVYGIENYSFDETKTKEQRAYAHYRAWNSDRDANGLIEACIKNAIDASKFFIVILSENSLKSEWVAKEVQLAINKVKSGLWSEESIIVIYLDEKASKILNSIKNKDNPFYSLKEYTGSFVNAKDTELIPNICERIKNGFEGEAIRRYIANQKKSGKQFKFVLRNQCENSLDENEGFNKFIDALIDFEDGYLKRDLHSRNNDNYDAKISVDEIMSDCNSFYLYGEGGSGKSLYLTNLINTYLKPPHFFIRINLIDYENWFNEDKSLTQLINKELNKYLTDSDEYRSEKALIRAKNGGANNIAVILDGLDEINDTCKRILLKMIDNYRKSSPSDRFIFTARKAPFYQDLRLLFDNLKLYEIKGLEKDEQEKLYDIICSKLENKQNIESNDEKNSLKLDFFIRLSDITGEIKKNPMLLSNLIFIYLKNRGKEFPSKKHEIIGKSVGIFIDELEEERNIRCKYSSYMANGKLRKILEFIAYQKLSGISLDFEKLICAYFEENVEAKNECLKNSDTPYDVGSEIYKYLLRRAIITTDKITHDIFTAFFASCFVYNKIYEGKISTRAISFKDEEYFCDLLKDGYDGFLGCDDGMWNEVSSELIMKLDYEINLLDPRPMRERHPSYNTFHKTLMKALTEKGFSQSAIDIISALANEKQGFYFSEFIKKYL